MTSVKKIDRLTVEVLGGLSIVLKGRTGVYFTNQAGGYACNHPKVMGLYIPLGQFNDIETTHLEEYFTSVKYGGWCENGIDDRDCDYLNELFKKLALSYPLSFPKIIADKSCKKDSMEAWINVIIKDKRFNGYDKGVLTWDNSD